MEMTIPVIEFDEGKCHRGLEKFNKALGKAEFALGREEWEGSGEKDTHCTGRCSWNA